MTSEEQLEQLKSENAQLREQLATQEALIAQLVERIQSLEGRLAQDSHNSSKPPSSDLYKRSPKKRSLRKVSGKKAGGQTGHLGQALRQVGAEEIDRVLVHRPKQCEKCQTALTGQPVLAGYEPRQVFELPPPYRLEVTEHQSYTIKCPACQHPTKAAFPKEVSNWVQYGAGFRAVAVYLVCQQLLPYGRACEILNEVYGASLSPGTLASLVSQTAEQLIEPEKAIVAALTKAKVLHCDETGLRVAAKRHWLHVASTENLTHYAVHPKRGKAATDAIGILPDFAGVASHDGWKSYQSYPCQHALCNAHHLRELTFVAEQLGQEWANDFKALLRDLKAEVEAAKALGQSALAPTRLVAYETAYQQLIETGLLANPPPPGGWVKGKRGKVKQTKAKNLLDRLDQQREAVLLFAYRFEVPFDNNQAERDIRMVKVQQKVSGCFRSETGAKQWCRIRGYLSSLKKQGQNLLVALLETFFGQPPLPNLTV